MAQQAATKANKTEKTKVQRYDIDHLFELESQLKGTFGLTLEAQYAEFNLARTEFFGIFEAKKAGLLSDDEAALAQSIWNDSEIRKGDFTNLIKALDKAKKLAEEEADANRERLPITAVKSVEASFNVARIRINNLVGHPDLIAAASKACYSAGTNKSGKFFDGNPGTHPAKHQLWVDYYTAVIPLNDQLVKDITKANSKNKIVMDPRDNKKPMFPRLSKDGSFDEEAILKAQAAYLVFLETKLVDRAVTQLAEYQSKL